MINLKGDKNIFQPVIKWSGSKRSQSKEIVKYFPKEIDTYYEPFCGGASVLRQLLDSDIIVNKYICSDINSDLINLWNEIKTNPDIIVLHYTKLWNELNKDDNIKRKVEFYNLVRDRFNLERSPFDFMFIMRTTVNGMPRYNSKGEFNTSFHLTRNGIEPKRFEHILCEWNRKLNDNKVEFICSDYNMINPQNNDFCYFDPPYANTKGMYFGAIDYECFWSYLRNLKSHYILSFDGVSGSKNNTYHVPEDVYKTHCYLLNGNSSFKRTVGKSNDSIVYESLYVS